MSYSEEDSYGADHLDDMDASEQEGTIQGAHQFPLVGDEVGRYTIREVIERDSCGTLYRGHDRCMDRDVSLRFLRELLTDAQQGLFQREAKTIAGLCKHPFIAQIYEWGEWRGHMYMAMEYVPSSALRLLAQYPDGIPLAFALRIAADVAEALKYAHGQGILHRDIKPSNLLVDPHSGQVRVTEFGTTRLFGGKRSWGPAVVAGSPIYLAPEQLGGADVDFRADIYALGVTLYQLLCGRLPIEGADFIAVSQRILNGEGEPLRNRRSDLPRLVYEIVERATAFDPAMRYSSAEAMMSDLRQAISMLQEGEREQPKQGFRALFAQTLSRIRKRSSQGPEETETAVVASASDTADRGAKDEPEEPMPVGAKGFREAAGGAAPFVFVSAKSADYDYAQEVYRYLLANGMSAFFSRESLPELANSDYRREIDLALDKAQHMVVVVSSVAHAQSPWVEAEWGFFINEKRSGRKVGNLVTLTVGSLRPEDLPPSLRYYEVIPFDAQALQKMLRYVRNMPA